MNTDGWNSVEVVLTAENNLLTPPETNALPPSSSKSATMAGVAVLRYEQDGDQFICCCSTQGHDRTYTFKRVGTDGRTELFQCVDCLRAVSHFNENPTAIGTVRVEEGSYQLAVSPDEPEGLPHLCRRQASRQSAKKASGAGSSADASSEASGGPTSSSSSGYASTSKTPTAKRNLQRRKPRFPTATRSIAQNSTKVEALLETTFPTAKRSSALKPAKEEALLENIAEQPEGPPARAGSTKPTTEQDVPGPSQSSSSTPKKKSPLISLIVLDDSPEPASGSTENPIFLDDSRPPPVQTFGVPKFKDKEKRVLLYESRRYKGRTFEFHHFSTDQARSKSLYRCLHCKAVAEKLPNQKMFGVMVRQGVIYRHDPDYLFGDDGHLCMTYDANGNRKPEDAGHTRAEKPHESTTEKPSDDAALSFGPAEFDDVEQIIKFRSKLYEGHVFEFEHCNTKKGRRFYVCRGCRAKNGRKMITALNGTLVDQDPDRGHRCVSTSASATEPLKRAMPKRAAAAAALRSLEATESDDDRVVDESDLPEDSIWRLDDSHVKARTSSSSASLRSTPQLQKKPALAASPAAQYAASPAAQQAQANPAQPPIRMVWAPPQKVFGRANYKDKANTVLMYESRRWPGQILILCREGPNMSGRQRFKCRRCTSTPEGKLRGHPPVIVQDGEIINQDPDELYQPEGHICMQDNTSAGTSTSASKPVPAQSTPATPKTQEVRNGTPAVVVNPCPRPGRPASSVMSRDPPKVIAPAKFEDASENMLLYESGRFPGTVFRFAKKSGGPTGKRFYTCVDCDPLSVTKRKPVRVAIVVDGNIVGNNPDNLYDDVGHLCQADASRPYMTPMPPQPRNVTPAVPTPASDASTTPKNTVASAPNAPTTPKQSAAAQPTRPLTKKRQASPETETSSDESLTPPEPARKRASSLVGAARATRASTAEAKSRTEIMHEVLDKMIAKDHQKVFLEPVSNKAILGYYRSVIMNPMDLATMRKKLDSGAYASWDAFSADFLLMVNNCATFNKDNTFYEDYAHHFKTVGMRIVHDAKTRATKNPKKAQASPESPEESAWTPESTRKRMLRSDGPARRTRASAAVEAEPTPASVPTPESSPKQASRASSRPGSSVSNGNGDANTPMPANPEPSDETMQSPDDYVPGPSPGPSPSTPVSTRSPSEQPALETGIISNDAGNVAVKQEVLDQETENVPPPQPTPGTADASRKRPNETPATQTAVKQEPADSVDEEVPAKRSRQAEPTPPTEEPEAEADQQEPEDFGEAVFADDTQKVLLYESLKHPGATLKFLRAGTGDGATYYVCAQCAAICKQRKLKMGRLVVQDGRLMTDPEVINGEGHGHYCLEEQAEDSRRGGFPAEPSQTEATGGEQEQIEQPQTEAPDEQAHPCVQPTEPASSEAQGADAPLLRAPKREPDVELLDGPRMPEVPVKKSRSSCGSSSTNTPSLPPLTASSSFSKPPVAVAYFGDAVYDRPDDPSSFIYESDLYGSFKFVLVDEVEKEDGGQLSIMRLYRCEACFELSQTHMYRDEVVHTIMTSGQRIVKYDPDTPRGIPHLCVRHRRSIVKKPVT